MTQRDLTPYTCPGGMLLVRARHAGPPRSNQPLEHAPHLHTCRASLVRVSGPVSLPVHDVDGDGVAAVLELGAGAAAVARLPVLRAHGREESLGWTTLLHVTKESSAGVTRHRGWWWAA